MSRIVTPPDKLPTDTKYRAPQFIETYTGRPFFSLTPQVSNITVIDIAHALSNQCRYSGHTAWFFSTAQHCCLLEDYVRMKMRGTALDRLQILMHDAPEAYLVDMARPVKQFMPQYRVWDHAINNKVREWLGISDLPIPEWQDDLDSRIVEDEREQLFSDSGLDWEHNLEPLGVNIDRWGSDYAEQQFLARYAKITAELYGTSEYLRAEWGYNIKTECRETSFRTQSSDVGHIGDADPTTVTDVLEVDLRGGVARVRVRSPDGMLVRDRRAGRPRPAWKWLHGEFKLIELTESRSTGVA